jgi:hypothetical protein
MVLDQATGRRPVSRRRRRRAPEGRRAREGDGVQRRAEAPEGRGPALSLLGGRARPRRLGGDAERLPVQPDVDRPARPTSGARFSSATRVIPAWWHWSRSTNPGASPIFRTAPRSATTCRRSTTSRRRSTRCDRSSGTTDGRASPPTSSASTTTTSSPIASDSATARTSSFPSSSSASARAVACSSSRGTATRPADPPHGVRRHRVLARPDAWGYSRWRARRSSRNATRPARVVRNLQALAGFCYTQFADTYQEANGLLYADRTPKFPLADIAAATRGPKGARDLQIELAWRERLMSEVQRQVVLPVEDALPPDR